MLLRLLFQLVRADFYNPLAQFLVTLTNAPLLPLRRVVPPIGGVDTASIVLLFALEILELHLLHWIQGVQAFWTGILVLSASALLNLTLLTFMVAIIIRALLSWVNPYGMSRNPAADLLYSLTEPMLAPARRLIGIVGGLDLSPIAVLLLLQATRMLVVYPLTDFGCPLAPFAPACHP